MSGMSGRGKAPPKTKESGGFWKGLVEGLVGGLASAPPSRSRNPADPAARMEPVHQEREETGREMIFRATEGNAGQAPMVRVDRQRQGPDPRRRRHTPARPSARAHGAAARQQPL